MSKSLNDYLDLESISNISNNYENYIGLILVYDNLVSSIWIFKDKDLYAKKTLLFLEEFFTFPILSSHLDKEKIEILNKKYEFVKNNLTFENIHSIIFSIEFETYFEGFRFQRFIKFKNYVKIINNEEDLKND